MKRDAFVRTGALVSLIVGVTACTLSRRPLTSSEQIITDTPTVQPTETIPPYTPLASLTPSPTLRPPPTFEPPTPTVLPTHTATVTLSPTVDLSISIEGLHGAETPTPSSTPGCKPRNDWSLRITVQANDALERIAARYNTSIADMAAANCLRDPNVIVIGQELRVPGAAHPQQPAVECVPWEVVTPMNGTMAVAGDGQLSFNWRGPRAPRNLIRIIRPDGSMVERMVELRQNESIDIGEELPGGGTYTWYVFPLDEYYVQINCREGGPWTFTKAQAPTPTPTSTPGFMP